MSLLISVVVPVYNEEGAVAELVREIDAAFVAHFGENDFEILFVDDKSRDKTLETLQTLKSTYPRLRVLSHQANAGQSRAIRSGVLAANGDIIVTMDGDGQNPPADAPKLVQTLLAADASIALVGGQRVKRQDSVAKKWASKWANSIRKSLLKDGCDDTGCGLKAIRREVFLRLPYFDHIHRYIPALIRREGYGALFLPVGHRHRSTGVSKYTNFGRLMVAFSDLMEVMWLNRRARLPKAVKEL
jgi:dolichol-phosphate mannosyltransferase